MTQKTNRVLTVGGGSAGHVAPVLAVIDELAAHSPEIEVRFWCNRGFMRQSKALISQATIEVKVEKIFAGKLRRYHKASLISILTDIPTLYRNFTDLFIIGMGFIQSLFKLVLWRPQVMFCKGGFVCLPAGYAAALLRIPIVIHDSDAHPGLTNRLLARHATYIATGAPLEYYQYPVSKARYVGIPTRAEFRLYNEVEKKQTKESFNLSPELPLLVVVGGGLGAKKINDALVAIAPQLISHMSVVHITGLGQYDDLKNKVPEDSNYKLVAFLSNHLAQLLGAADIVVTRVGATAMAELAAVGASVIMIPNARLVGGHQLKNAQVFVDANAALAIDENILKKHPEILLSEIISLLKDTPKRRTLSGNLLAFAKPQSAKNMAHLIEQAGMKNVI